MTSTRIHSVILTLLCSLSLYSSKSPLEPPTIEWTLAMFDNVQKIPNVLKHYIANKFIIPQHGIYVEDKKSYSPEQAKISEPFEYNDFGEKTLPSRYLRYHTNNNKYQKVTTKNHLIHCSLTLDCSLTLVGPNKKGFFIVDKIIKNVFNPKFEYSLLPQKILDRMAMGLSDTKEEAFSVDKMGQLYKHMFSNNQCFTQRLAPELPHDFNKPFKQLIVTNNSLCVVRTHKNIYIASLETMNYVPISIDNCISTEEIDIFLKNNKVRRTDYMCPVFSHIDYTNNFPDHLLIEITFDNFPFFYQGNGKLMKKIIVFHLPSLEHQTVTILKKNECISRWVDEDLTFYSRKVHASPSKKTEKIRNVVHMVSPKKTRALLHAYLILTAADVWNKQKDKSKEEAGAIIKRLKQIPYAGCIYTIKGFKNIFDEMRKLL